jgi:hypothetical protein
MMRSHACTLPSTSAYASSLLQGWRTGAEMAQFITSSLTSHSIFVLQKKIFLYSSRQCLLLGLQKETSLPSLIFMIIYRNDLSEKCCRNNIINSPSDY